MPSGGESFHILVVDDHEPTARLIRMAFDDVDASATIHLVPDGEGCLAIVRGESDESFDPDFVLLDLGLPDIDGIDVLESIRNDPDACHIPIVVLSGQSDEDTVHRCYKKGVNAFMPKPDDLDEYFRLAQLIVAYWGSGAKLPSPETA